MASASPWKCAVQSPAVSLASLMDEQYAEKLQKESGAPLHTTVEEGEEEQEGGMVMEGDEDDELALALALSMSMAPFGDEHASATTAVTEDGKGRQDEDTASVEAAHTTTEPSTASSVQQQAGVDSDYALAMALQERERRELERITQYLREHKGEKVQLSFHGLVPDDVHTWRLLRGEDFDAAGLEDGRGDGRDDDDDDQEQGGNDDSQRLGIASMVKDGRRRKRGEMLRAKDGSIITKHDADLNARMNAFDMTRQLENAGDMDDGDFRIPNRVFNSLRQDMKKGESFKGVAARGRIEGSTRATQDGVLDPRTRLILFKMLNKGIFSEVGGCVKTGKESNLYFAPSSTPHTEGVAVKVFKTTLNEFSQRCEYIDSDPRYKPLKFNRQPDRQKYKIWAKKELRNLIRIHRAGIPCPEPLEQKEHVLAMTFLGVDGWPSPQLREVKLSHKTWASCYAQVLGLMRQLYQRAELVHGDLSEYNVLWHQGKCFLIDVGQSVHIGHPRSDEFLRADMTNTTDFFRRQGVKTVDNQDEALSFVRSRVVMVRQVDKEEEEEEGGEEEEEEEEEEEGGEDEEGLMVKVLERLVAGEAWVEALEAVGLVVVEGKDRRKSMQEEEEEDEDEEEDEEEDDEDGDQDLGSQS